MHMKYRLPAGVVDIDSHIPAVRMMTCLNHVLYLLKQRVEIGDLICSQLEEIRHMSFGDDERMSGADRETVKDGKTQGTCGNYLPIRWQVAKQAG